MPIIKPASALRNDYPSITRLAREARQPVFLTKNGTGDMVLLTMEDYDQKISLIELYEKLREGEDDIKNGRYKTFAQANAVLDAKIAEYGVEG